MPMEQQEFKVNAKEILTRLARLQADLDFVKEHIEDITLTEDDLKSLEEAEKEHKAGRTTSLDDFKKEMRL